MWDPTLLLLDTFIQHSFLESVVAEDSFAAGAGLGRKSANCLRAVRDVTAC